MHLKVKVRNLSQALYCNEQYWPAIESLCTVLFALQDFTGNWRKTHLQRDVVRVYPSCIFLLFLACLQVIGKALELEPQFPRGRF